MKKSKITGYYLILAFFIVTAIPYVLEFVYLLGEDCLSIKLLPEPIWKSLDIYFYYEALPFRILIIVARLLLLSILILIFYRKNVSIATVILTAITPIISAFGSSSPYWLSKVTDKEVIVFIIIFIVCIVHIVTTGIFLIKDAIQLNKE